MSTENIDKAWEEIEKRVTDSFDKNDVCANYGLECWKKEVEKVRKAEELSEIAYQFIQQGVLDAAVEFFKADIEDNMAFFRMKVSRNTRLLKLMNIRIALGEQSGIFIDEDEGERIVPEILAVIRVSKSAKKKILSQVVESAMTLANNNGDANGEKPVWSAAFGEGIDEFAKDLDEFISANGEDGSNMVRTICRDLNYAKKISNDDNMPKPIRALAGFVMEIRENKLASNKEAAIGFNAGAGD